MIILTNPHPAEVLSSRPGDLANRARRNTGLSIEPLEDRKYYFIVWQRVIFKAPPMGGKHCYKRTRGSRVRVQIDWWIDAQMLLYLYRSSETRSPSALSSACLITFFPLGVHWFMTTAFISHSISRWWIGWSFPAATLGLVFCLTNYCSAALTNLPTQVYVPVCRAFSTTLNT